MDAMVTARMSVEEKEDGGVVPRELGLAASRTELIDTPIDVPAFFSWIERDTGVSHP